MLRKAPISFAGLSILGIALGFGLAHTFLSTQITTKDGEISRYRIALGIDTASKGNLIELNNQELSAKASNTAAKLRDICFTLRKRSDELKNLFDTGKISKKDLANRQTALDKDIGEDFARNLRADAFNVDNELRRRLKPEVVSTIIGISPTVTSNDGARIDMLQLLPAGYGMDAQWTCVLADGIEQMAKLLPPDAPKQ